MARIRTIKPEFWTDSFMVQLPPLARLLFISLWSASDDHGCIYDEPERLAMEVMPRERPVDVDGWLQFFWASGKLDYCIAEDGSTFWQIKSWDKHQRIDKPSKSRFPREGSRKVAIPQSVRREVAIKYGCSPGESIEAHCYYCNAPGLVSWFRLADGRPSAWVTFPGLELDHLEAEVDGGETSKENMILACRHCNRSKADGDWFEKLMRANGCDKPGLVARAREPSPPEGKGRESNGREGNKQPSKQAAPNTSQAVPDDAPLAALAAVCLRSRVNADGGKGLLHLRQFVADGVTEAMLTDAVLLARDRKPDPEVIPIAYLAPIISDLRSGKARARPATWEETKAAAMAAIAAKEAASGPH